ncbi:MAG: cob(I)yrinic acid a,c-diamide adenosyltransferase [Brevinematia bacterium]
MSNLKIYTKIGDNGETYTLGGGKVRKSHIKIEVYGEIDELTSWLGVIISHLNDLKFENASEEVGKEVERIIDFLVSVQNRLFDTGTLVIGGEIKELESWTSELENEIDYMEGNLEPLKKFILPGGSKISSFIHIARTVCRRAERGVVKLSELYPIDLNAIKYLNRLSDYLFVLARYVNKIVGVKDIIKDESIYVKNKLKIKKFH